MYQWMLCWENASISGCSRDVVGRMLVLVDVLWGKCLYQ